jgi:glucokinase
MSIIAVDLGGTRIKAGLIINGRVESLTIKEISTNEGLSDYLPVLHALIADLNRQDQSVTGIGIGFPGLVDTDKNTVIDTSGKYNDAPDIDLVGWARDEFGLNLKIENDARLACLGEWKYGAGTGYDDMVMCTLGTGIGSSAIINGKILRGRHFQAGILGGHSIIDYRASQNVCSCGKYGCVEALASNWAVRKMATQHPLFRSSSLSTRDEIDLALIFEMSEQSDELSVLLRDHCMSVWSVGLVNLIHAYDPEVVVVGGGIMHAKEIVLPYFEEQIKKRLWCPSGVPELRSADYPDSAALLGATQLFE